MKLRTEAEAAKMALPEAEADMAKLRQAEDTRKARGRWQRIRAAWARRGADAAGQSMSGQKRDDRSDPASCASIHSTLDELDIKAQPPPAGG